LEFSDFANFEPRASTLQRKKRAPFVWSKEGGTERVNFLLGGESIVQLGVGLRVLCWEERVLCNWVWD